MYPATIDIGGERVGRNLRPETDVANGDNTRLEMDLGMRTEETRFHSHIAVEEEDEFPLGDLNPRIAGSGPPLIGEVTNEPKRERSCRLSQGIWIQRYRGIIYDDEFDS